MKIASIVLLPDINPCILSIFKIFLNLPLITPSETFIACSNNLMPICKTHMSVHHLFLCKHSPFNSCSNPWHFTIFHHSIKPLLHFNGFGRSRIATVWNHSNTGKVWSRFYAFYGVVTVWLRRPRKIYGRSTGTPRIC